MITMTYFDQHIRIYNPVHKCITKMSSTERSDYSVQLSDYVAIYFGVEIGS